MFIYLILTDFNIMSRCNC